MDPLDARSNDESRSVNRAVAPLSLSLYLLTRRQLSPVGFDPRGVYDLPVQSAFFRRFLREPREIYLVARALLLLHAEPCGPRGAFRRLDNWV